ncbi:MAG: ABC transporter ATP-binding protein [Fimbriimonadaceae bacterium]|jgi:ABC-type multidrug transport system ATPase subunit|nr:ABC transporter ATP-binding protein [Fimbriimonadaceae bacterium]
MVLAQAQNLGRKFGDRWVIRRLEFELRPRDVLLLTGNNGSGKSTVLKILAGLLSPSEGSFQIAQRFGYSALDLAVYPALTAREHLLFSAKVRNCPDRADELLRQLGLQRAIDQRAGEFSTGMRARLKLALAIQHKPDVLLLDEPSAALDEAGQEALANLLEEFEGAVLLATNEKEDGRFGTLGLHLS